MKVVVIGAGAAGLCAARHLAALPEIVLVVFEQTASIGGTWVYNDNTGIDTWGLPIHSSMYKNLRTNLPKETMEFLSFPFKHEESFISRKDVLQYLEHFADCYDLKKHIKFLHHVLKVTPINNTWEVNVRNLQTNEIDVSYFDVVVVCNGHFSQPRFPEFTGMDKYVKTQMHSHEYRDPERFKGSTVTVVGSGPSGVDITFDIAASAKKVIFSHHNSKLLNSEFPKNVVHKPDIKFLTENEVIFDDGTNEAVDVIIYCTGYEYCFPFLSKSCSITIEDNFVQPLYKHLININYPTMWFIGIPWQTLIFPLFDLQVRCLKNVLLKKVHLPAPDEMLLDLQSDMKEKRRSGVKLRYYHRLGTAMDTYTIDLVRTFNVEPIPEIVNKIYNSAKERRIECLGGYRGDVYEVIDSSNYVLHKNKVTNDFKCYHVLFFTIFLYITLTLLDMYVLLNIL